ncbi:MAG TPA: LysR family transcriptional regulator substrate-binding protein, partial [Gemmatimonadales bacterium]|nr:LysR family transcriptional regulator substrate-binding protein [Gemmatimonadales bacterium]
PHVTITVWSLASIEIQRGLDDFTLDVGLTYLDNEPLSSVRTIPLYRESYFLFTPADGPLAHRDSVSWAEAATVPLCLLTPDMQNRRILDGHFRAADAEVHPAIQTNSVLTLWSHLRSLAYSSVLSQTFLYLFGEPEGLRAIPIERPKVVHTVGLVIPDREPLTPSARELARICTTIDVTASLEQGKPLVPARS